METFACTCEWRTIARGKERHGRVSKEAYIVSTEAYIVSKEAYMLIYESASHKAASDRCMRRGTHRKSKMARAHTLHIGLV